MKLPMLTELNTTRDMIDVFKGYNHNLRIGEGEFYHMKNLTSDYYPVLSPCKRRGLYLSPNNAQGLIAKDSLCYVDGQDFVINQNRIELDLSEAEDDCPKTLVSMGAYVIILPDKKYVNTADLTDYGSIDASFTTNSTVTFQISRVDGSNFTRTNEDGEEESIPIIISATQPEEPKNLDVWVDTSSTPNTYKQWSDTNDMWVTIATTYIKISATGIGRAFSVNDGVTISGVEDSKLSDLNNTMVIWSKGDDWIVVTGIIDSVTTQSNPITIKREMPKMDFIIESENRLWGCRYGVANNGEVVNEIYASKLGDFKNWNCFMGISTDSYAATVGTDGQFTGAIAHLGHPIFFKENHLHKVYGNYPANYQITATTCRGVQDGSHKSLAIVNEVLFYKSRTGVCAYDGSLPQEVSYAFGDVAYSNAVACSHGNKYYVSMRDDSTDAWHLFAYDAAKNMWHREDNTRVDAFCSCRGELYYIDHQDGFIKTMFGSGTPDSEKVEWEVETGLIGTDNPDRKYISKLNIRMSLELGARVYCFIQYDSEDNWNYVFRMDGTSLRTFTAPIKPRRCDHMRIRLEGIGECKIYSITKTIAGGSDSK